MNRPLFLRIYIFGIFIASCVFLWSIIQSARGLYGDITGFSNFQLISLVFLGLWVVFTLILSIYSIFRDKWFVALLTKTEAFRRYRMIWVAVPVLCVLAAVLGYIFVFWGELPEPFVAYHERLLPLAGWATVVSFWSILLMVALSADWSRMQDMKDILTASGFAAGILFVIVLFIAITQLGLEPDRVWWAAPGAPVLIWQSFVAWGVGAVFLLAESRFHFLWSDSKKRRAYDTLIFILLWLFSAWFWAGLPVQSDHFITDRVPPNFEYYPYSDAATYDLGAQELLIGNGFSNDAGSKPAYSLFMALLHLLAGQDYEKVVWLQTLIMGMIPSLMFLLVSRLGNRSAGLVAAILIIFREQNSILLTRVIRVSHVKMIMTEPLILAVILFLILLLVHWFEKPASRSALLIVIGGGLGLSVLLRGQMLVLVPVVALIVLLQTWKKWNSLVKAGGLLLLGAVLALSPWLLRNYQTRNEISLKETLPRDWMLATKYSLTPEIRLEPPEGVSLDEYNKQMRSRVIDFVIQHPDVVAQFVSAHFFHNLIEGVVYLPLSFGIDSPVDYVKESPYWVSGWRGAFPFEGGLLLFVNLGLIALGIGTSWARIGRGMLVPIFISIGYVFSVSIARFSGWRFIMPADWLSLVFYSIGCVQLIKIVYSLITKNLQIKDTKGVDAVSGNSLVFPNRKTVLLLCTGILLLGSVFPITEKMFPEVYPILSEQDALKLYGNPYATSSVKVPSPDAIANFIQQNDAVVLYGRALYPRYFRSGQSLGGNSPVYNDPPNSSLIFSLVGPRRTLVVLPLESRPDHFPNASDVLVIGCRGIENSVNAFVVVVMGDTPVILRQPYTDQSSCPLVFP